jgi:hypothetical protein
MKHSKIFLKLMSFRMLLPAGGDITRPMKYYEVYTLSLTTVVFCGVAFLLFAFLESRDQWYVRSSIMLTLGALRCSCLGCWPSVADAG